MGGSLALPPSIVDHPAPEPRLQRGIEEPVGRKLQVECQVAAPESDVGGVAASHLEPHAADKCENRLQAVLQADKEWQARDRTRES